MVWLPFPAGTGCPATQDSRAPGPRHHDPGRQAGVRALDPPPCLRAWVLCLFGSLLAAVGTLRGQEFKELPHHGGSLQAARFARAADRLATSGSLPGRIVVWDTAGWQPVRVWNGLEERPGVLIDDSGTLVLAYTARHLQALVVAADTAPVTIELPDDRQLTGIALAPDGQRAFIFAGKRVEGEATWIATSYSTRSGERENETTLPGRPLQASFSSDSQQLVVLTLGQGLLLSCRTFRARSLPELASHDALAERFDGLQLVARKGLEVRRFNTVTGALTTLTQIDPPEQGPFEQLRPCISPDGRFLACQTSPERLTVRDLGNSSVQRTIETRTALPLCAFPVPVLDFKWSRDAKRIYTVLFNGSVLACNPEDGSVSEIFSCCASGGKVDRVWALAGRLAASGSGSELVVVDHEAGRIVWRRPRPESPAALGICKDEAWVCARTAGAGGEIMIHDAATGRLLEQRRLEHWPTAIEMSPDGSVVATVEDWDSRKPFVSTDVEVWSRPERKPLFSLPIEALPHSLAFSRDSRWLAVSCGQRRGDLRHLLSCIDVRERRVRTELTLPAADAAGFGRAVLVSEEILASYDDRNAASHKRFLRWWNPAKAELLEEIPVYNSRFLVLQHGGRRALLEGQEPFHPSDKKAEPGGLQLVDLKTRGALWRGADRLEATAAAWTEDDRKALIGFADGGLGVLEVKDPAPRADSGRE